jgi:hypothetical protein
MSSSDDRSLSLRVSETCSASTLALTEPGLGSNAGVAPAHAEQPLSFQTIVHVIRRASQRSHEAPNAVANHSRISQPFLQRFCSHIALSLAEAPVSFVRSTGSGDHVNSVFHAHVSPAPDLQPQEQRASVQGTRCTQLCKHLGVTDTALQSWASVATKPGLHAFIFGTSMVRTCECPCIVADGIQAQRHFVLHGSCLLLWQYRTVQWSFHAHLRDKLQ